jgi:S-adenosylmethionine hydrolase
LQKTIFAVTILGMPLITLTTEWREDDFFNGILRGKLSSACPGTVIVNNAGSIPPLNISHGAFVIRNTYSHYPEGSIHLVFVSSEGGGSTPPSAGQITQPLVHRC